MTLRGRRRSPQAGFSLIEVMVALLMLGMGLGVLLRSAAGNLQTARRAEMYAVATELGRSKMYDLEEELIQEGFQETDQELDGDFDDEGWKDISWKATIVKIELPNLSALTAVGASAAATEGEDTGGAPGGGVLGAMLGFLPPGLGATGGVDAAAAAGAAVVSSQYEMISSVLEASIRKVTLTVAWKNGRYTGNIVLDCYFTDPAAISRQLGGLGALAGQAGGSAGGSSSSGSSARAGN